MTGIHFYIIVICISLTLNVLNLCTHYGRRGYWRQWSKEVEETGEPGKTTNLRCATTTLPHPVIPANETWTVLKVLDRVYGQGYSTIGSDWVG